MSELDEIGERTEYGRQTAETVMDNASAVGVPGGDMVGLVNAGFDVNKGASEIDKGDTTNGVLDVGIGATGVLEKGSSLVKEMSEAGGNDALAPGLSTVGNVASTVGGGLKMAKGADEIATDTGYGGKTLDGIHDLLAGGSDALGGVAGNSTVGAAAKVFGGGMKVGDALAPVVFGDMKNTGSHMEDVPDGGDGQFHASTGNRAIDWICGTGKYTNGRW